MIQAKHTRIHHLFFRHYIRCILKKDFREFGITGSFEDRDMPVLIIGNHFSWWDGFIAYELNNSIFRRRFHIMMLEEQLSRYMFFRHLGAFSIKPGSRSALESIHYAGEFLRDKNNLLILFPQGKIQSLHNDRIEFRRGWFRILKDPANPVHVLFMANFVDYLSHRKPSLSINIETYPPTSGFVFDDISNNYYEFFQRSLEKQRSVIRP